MPKTKQPEFKPLYIELDGSMVSIRTEDRPDQVVIDERTHREAKRVAPPPGNAGRNLENAIPLVSPERPVPCPGREWLTKG